MKKILSFILLTGLLSSLCACSNVKQTIPRIDNEFTEKPVLSDFSTSTVENAEEEKETKYEVKENYERLGAETYGYIDLPVGWYTWLEKDSKLDLLQYTDGNNTIVTLYPYKRAEMAGNASKMIEVFKDSFSGEDVSNIEEKELEINGNKAYALYIDYEDKTSAALFLLDETIEDPIKDKQFVKYIFMESPKENDVQLFDTIYTYSLNSEGIGKQQPTKVDKDNTLTIFNQDNFSKNQTETNFVEIQNKQKTLSIIPPSDYRIVMQDKFVAKLTNDKYDVTVSFLDSTEAEYIRISALNRYNEYLKKTLDYSNVNITNDTIKITDDYIAAHYTVFYRYNELKQDYQYHYYAFKLEKGLYIIEVVNHENNDFDGFDISTFLNLK